MVDEVEKSEKFDASKYITHISGKPYLEVKWRLLWLRTLHPDAVISTELVRDDGETATFRSLVTIPDGGSATGWGQESGKNFGDYLEKAETKSLGRALAALGYGTQFADDFEMGDKTVDNSVGAIQQGQTTSDRAPGLASDRQIKAIFAIGRNEAGLSEADIKSGAMMRYKLPVDQLTVRYASDYIEALKSGWRPGPPGAPVIEGAPYAAPADNPTRSPNPMPTNKEFSDFWSESRAGGWPRDAVIGMATLLVGRSPDRCNQEELARVRRLFGWPYKECEGMMTTVYGHGLLDATDEEARGIEMLVNDTGHIVEVNGTPTIAPIA